MRVSKLEAWFVVIIFIGPATKTLIYIYTYTYTYSTQWNVTAQNLLRQSSELWWVVENLIHLNSYSNMMMSIYIFIQDQSKPQNYS